MPIQLIRGTDTTPPGAGVVAALGELWPTANIARIDGAGHLAPITHPGDVNAVIEMFIGDASGRT